MQSGWQVFISSLKGLCAAPWTALSDARHDATIKKHATPPRKPRDPLALRLVPMDSKSRDRSALGAILAGNWYTPFLAVTLL